MDKQDDIKNKVDEPSVAYNDKKHEVITDFNQLDLDKLYTYTEYLSWQFTERVELIKGKIFEMFAAPNRTHQRISMRISSEIDYYLKGKSCEIYSAPFDVRFPNDKNDKNPYTVVQPDICIICDPEKLDEKGCNGAPDLIVEILSPSTSKKDTSNKFELYEEYGVKEYWIVDPVHQVLDIFDLKKGKYQLRGKFNNESVVSVGLFSDLKIDMSEVFESL